MQGRLLSSITATSARRLSPLVRSNTKANAAGVGGTPQRLSRFGFGRNENKSTISFNNTNNKSAATTATKAVFKPNNTTTAKIITPTNRSTLTKETAASSEKAGNTTTASTTTPTGTSTAVQNSDLHAVREMAQSVGVRLTRNELELLRRRLLNPKNKDDTCCTHPDWEEDATDCAVRRLDEELGITGLYPTHRQQIEYRADVGNDLTEHEVVEVYVADAPNDLQVTPNPDEVMAVRWVDFYDLRADIARHPTLYTPWLQIYLRDYADTLFGDLMRTA